MSDFVFEVGESVAELGGAFEVELFGGGQHFGFEFFDVFDSLLRWSNFVGVGDSSEDGDGDVPGDECNFLLNERRNEIVSLSSVL